MQRNRFRFTRSVAWRETYPTAAVGVLVMSGVANPSHHEGLERQKKELEKELWDRFHGQDRAAIKAIPVVRAYSDYYMRFGKTYHVQLQLESVALKRKPIPRVATLVEALFMAELRNQMLTAGHDMDAVQMPVGVGVSDGSESYVRINGQHQQMKAGDMIISDSRGIISCIIYGPDQRTRITPTTREVLFTAYAPPGIDRDALRRHLGDIRTNVSIVAPGAQVEVLDVYGTE